MKDKIAFVCQRYGKEVNGGAETECRMYAERLTPFFDVDVITTCALDYMTWSNYYEEGESTLNNVRIIRLKVNSERKRNQLAILSRVVAAKHSDKLEEKWIDMQGPDCPMLIEFLKNNGRHYKTVIFMTYLYYSTVRGIMQEFNDVIFIPTAHDEWQISLKIFDSVFEKADKFIYNTNSEKEFVEKRFKSALGKPSITIGAGVEEPKGQLPDVKERFGINDKYVCYCGRIAEGKGCRELFDFFLKFKKKHKINLKLVLTGNTDINIPKDEDIIYLGFVSEAEKFAVMKEAQCFVLASRNESLSIVVLESLMMGTPVLVSGHCEVLKDHCIESNAGFYYTNYEEFDKKLTSLLEDEEQYKKMQENGKHYVESKYNWDVIVKKMVDLINM